MTKNAGIITAIIAVLVIGGAIYYGSKGSSTTSTTTPPTTYTPTTPTAPTPPITGTVRTPGLPTVSTNSTVSPTDTTAVVTGTVVPNGVFTSYWYEYGVSPNFGYKTTTQTVGSGYGVIPTPGYITGLVRDTTYYFRLVAENQYGRVGGSTYTFLTTHGNPPPVGSAPSVRTVAASGVSRTTANFNGTVDPNNASTQYWFEYGDTTNLGNTTSFVGIGSGTENVTASVSISNLLPLTTYYFRLNAQNQFGTVNGSIMSFKTSGPAASSSPSVTTRTAISVSSTTAMVRGTVNPNGLETTYWFEYDDVSPLGTNSFQATDHISVGGGVSPVAVDASISDLNKNTTYYFRLVSENSLGVVRGDTISFKTKAQ